KKGISLRVATNLFLFAGFQAFLVSTYYTGAIQSPVLFWFVFLPVCAIFMRNEKDALIWLGVSLLSVGFFLLKAPRTNEEQSVFWSFIFFVNTGLITLLTWMFYASE